MHNMSYQHNYNEEQADNEPLPCPGGTRLSFDRLNIFGLFPFLVLAFTFCFASSLHAQFPGGGFGNFGGGQNQNQNRSSSSTSQYPNNQVGDATFAIDPDTRKLVVIADE